MHCSCHRCALRPLGRSGPFARLGYVRSLRNLSPGSGTRSLGRMGSRWRPNGSERERIVLEGARQRLVRPCSVLAAPTRRDRWNAHRTVEAHEPHRVAPRAEPSRPRAAPRRGGRTRAYPPSIRRTGSSQASRADARRVAPHVACEPFIGTRVRTGRRRASLFTRPWHRRTARHGDLPCAARTRGVRPTSRADVVSVFARDGRSERARRAVHRLGVGADVVPLDHATMSTARARGFPPRGVDGKACRATLLGAANLGAVVRRPVLRERDELERRRCARLAAIRVPQHAVFVGRTRGEVVETYVVRAARASFAKRDEVRLRHRRAGGANGIRVSASGRPELLLLVRVHARNVAESRRAAAAAAAGHERKALARPVANGVRGRRVNVGRTSAPRRKSGESESRECRQGKEASERAHATKPCTIYAIGTIAAMSTQQPSRRAQAVRDGRISCVRSFDTITHWRFRARDAARKESRPGQSPNAARRLLKIAENVDDLGEIAGPPSGQGRRCEVRSRE